MRGDGRRPAVAVLIPCFNEAIAIGRVVRDFRAHLPDAVVYVYDNNSRDDTAQVARAAGAIVRHEPRQGKGNVVRRMFAEVDADAYVLVDGDATYDAASAPEMLARLRRERLDMVVGTRVPVGSSSTFRAGHRLGNTLFTRTIALLFGQQFTDVLSGYRCLSRRFVQTFPALAQGFETEAELSVHALELRLPSGEVPTPYRGRPDGSTSKLSTFRDGWRILMGITVLLKEVRPFLFFGLVAAALALLSVGLAVPVVLEYFETGFVRRFPTAILVTGIMVLAFVFLTAAVVLDSISRMRRETKRLAYLAVDHRAGRRPDAAVDAGIAVVADRPSARERSGGGDRPR